MRDHFNFRGEILAISAVAMLSMVSMAYGYYSALPDVQKQGEITYITGGVGDEERTALEHVRGNYNLHILNAARDGAYSGDTALVIYDHAGNKVVTTHADPLFYASLPSGKYTIFAENNGMQQHREVKLGSRGNADIRFVWK